MASFTRIICIVLDGVGCGAAPDAADYGDVGSNSLANTARAIGGIRLPVLQRLGLGCVGRIDGVEAVDDPAACWGRMQPRSAGKDSVSGHWELMGCPLASPFPTYPDGFPAAVVRSFERAIGRRVLANRAASGTEIIAELGDEHVATGSPILYTSQDSVFQLAAHEDVVPIDRLYAFCSAARSLLTGEHAVARVIARPFAGESGGYFRTTQRKDFAVAPPADTVLDALTAADRRVLTIGKISDLFNERGITESQPTRDNAEGMEATLRACGQPWDLVFTNLVDFDTMWGHRNDARAYALGLEEFDAYLGQLMSAVDPRTLVIVTSDHGNDPTTSSTDHSREFVPLIAWHPALRSGRALGSRETFADVGRTVADNYALAGDFPGSSFLRDLSVG